jgi:hypothetical protein
MRSCHSLLFIIVFIAGCGVSPTLIPPGSQPGTRPADSPTAALTLRAPETSSPSPAGATPGPSETGSAAAPTPLVSPDDAIRLVQQKYPELNSIQKMPRGTIGASTDVIVQDRPGGWNIIFWQGSGDCPAGCINNHYWYVSVEKSGSVTMAGEFVREFDSASNAVKTRGAPMWGVPRQ